MKKIGVIGCGTRINSLLKYMEWDPGQLRIDAVCDLDRARAEALAAKLPGVVRIHADADALLRDPALDWVMVMTPNAIHAGLVIRAFEAGKHVFSEKPMAVSFAECLAIWEAWKKSGRQYLIGFTLRYSPHYRKIREVVASGLIGTPVSLEFNENVLPEHGGHICCCWRRNRATTGFHLLEKCCHDLDIANYILDSVPMRGASFGSLSVFRPENAGLMEKYRDEDGTSVFCRWPTAKGRDPFRSDKDIVDHQVCILEYASGVSGTFHTNINCPINERRMYIAGTEGTLRADAISGVIEVRTLDGRQYDFSTGEKGSHAGGDRTLLKTLAVAVCRGLENEEAILSGVTSAATCFALDEAMRQGAVVDLRPWWEQLEKVRGKHNRCLSKCG